MTVKSAAYYQGLREEQARQAAREARAAGLDPAALSREVARNFARDEACKRRIFSRGLPFAVDASELAEMSSRELAARALKELGIEAGENDPVALLDAHHAGRRYERDRISGNGASAQDSGGDDFIKRYLRDGEG